jgi:hypothetical protein
LTCAAVRRFEHLRARLDDVAAGEAELIVRLVVTISLRVDAPGRQEAKGSTRSTRLLKWVRTHRHFPSYTDDLR